MRKSGEVVLWVTYFDAAKTRKEGRKIGRKLAIERPTADELARAIEMLGIPYKIDKSAAYPRAWWEKSGRILVSKVMPKGKMIISVAKSLRNVRAKGSS
nr:signal recognition particle subunit SRP19/SEC65 family protein [Candidatus Njordarchaeum guaymaensis]